MKWDITLAKELKRRDNPNKIGLVIGRIVSEKPIKISILDGQVLLDKTQLYKSTHIASHYYDKDKDNDLFVGDEVLLIPTENEQFFAIIDKVTKL